LAGDRHVGVFRRELAVFDPQNVDRQIERRKEFYFFNLAVDRVPVRDFAQDHVSLRRRRVPVRIEFFDGTGGYGAVLLLQEKSLNHDFIKINKIYKIFHGNQENLVKIVVQD